MEGETFNREEGRIDGQDAGTDKRDWGEWEMHGTKGYMVANNDACVTDDGAEDGSSSSRGRGMSRGGEGGEDVYDSEDINWDEWGPSELSWAEGKSIDDARDVEATIGEHPTNAMNKLNAVLTLGTVTDWCGEPSELDTLTAARVEKGLSLEERTQMEEDYGMKVTAVSGFMCELSGN